MGFGKTKATAGDILPEFSKFDCLLGRAGGTPNCIRQGPVRDLQHAIIATVCSDPAGNILAGTGMGVFLHLISTCVGSEIEAKCCIIRRLPMFRKLSSIAAIVLIVFLLGAQSPAQTTNGLMTGIITDAAGAVVAGVQVNVTDQGTGEIRTTTTDRTGHYIIPQLPPRIYDISIKKQGFATENRPNVQLQVNQSATIDFKLIVSSTTQTIQVTGIPPALNTTSATIGTVIGHSATVDLPLNGRQFTQLTLLTPGASPRGTPAYVPLGAGGVSPAVNGQRGVQNNFTMDSTENNQIFEDIWAISPPPDALQEFNVQSHITDAQFAISSGANINIVTRSGTNAFHGSAWEFARNSVLDAQQFPEVQRVPYSQNQYGLYLGGPIIKDNSWFSVYWEGFRSAQTQSHFGNTITAAMAKGDFSALLGSRVGTDCLGRPEYANEIYDPLTSRSDPCNPGSSLRDSFPGNIIPANRINPDAPLILQKYYPAPNLNVAANVLPNIQFSAANTTASDVTGIRLDHRFRNNDTLFGRYNRSNATLTVPDGLPPPSKRYKHLLATSGHRLHAPFWDHDHSEFALWIYRYK